jgi:capsule polysaccharide modification protein KpsS
MEKDKNADAYAKIANKWFIDRQNGISQNYTKLQNKSQTVTFNNPYFVFFHSSQDELDMLGLISKYWKNQVNSLSALIDIFKINSRFNLVLRIHPHLLYKSKIERHYWDEIGLNLQKRYSWFHYIPADSNINSYELIKNSRGIISCASTIGVEAAYLKKKSILLGRAFHEFMGVTQNPKNKEELTRMLFTENEAEEFEKAYESSLAYAYFSEMGGNFFKYVSYRLKYGRKIYEYKGFTISPLFIIRILRVVEEFIGGIFSNKKQGRCLRDCGINTRQGWQ